MTATGSNALVAPPLATQLLGTCLPKAGKVILCSRPTSASISKLQQRDAMRLDIDTRARRQKYIESLAMSLQSSVRQRRNPKIVHGIYVCAGQN